MARRREGSTPKRRSAGPGETAPARSRPRTPAPSRIIFSDVDGTFVDADGSIPFPASFLDRVAERYRVVFASSRTVEELRALQQQLGWRGYVIAEDGHVIGLPDGGVELLGVAHDEIVGRLRRGPAWTSLAALIDEHPESTRHRRASVLVPRAVAEDQAYDPLRRAIAEAGLSLTVGGEWCILGSGGSKADAARRVLALEELSPDDAVAVGNEANDAALLQAVPRAFVIRNADGHHPHLAAVRGAIRCRKEGPSGWLEMIDALDRAGHQPAEAD